MSAGFLLPNFKSLHGNNAATTYTTHAARFTSLQAGHTVMLSLVEQADRLVRTETMVYDLHLLDANGFVILSNPFIAFEANNDAEAWVEGLSIWAMHKEAKDFRIIAPNGKVVVQ